MAMFMTTLTTMIGFGSLLFAEYNGLRTVGLVAVIGLATNLLSCYIVMPLLIKIQVHFGFRKILPIRTRTQNLNVSA